MSGRSRGHKVEKCGCVLIVGGHICSSVGTEAKDGLSVIELIGHKPWEE